KTLNKILKTKTHMKSLSLNEMNDMIKKKIYFDIPKKEIVKEIIRKIPKKQKKSLSLNQINDMIKKKLYFDQKKLNSMINQIGKDIEKVSKKGKKIHKDDLIVLNEISKREKKQEKLLEQEDILEDFTPDEIQQIIEKEEIPGIQKTKKY